MTGQPHYDSYDDVPVHVRRQPRGGWGLVAPQVYGIAHFVPEFQFSGRPACSGTDPEYFFPESGQWDVVIARRICAGCPVRVECLAWALKNREMYGIWGGTTYKQRMRMWIEQQKGELP